MRIAHFLTLPLILLPFTLGFGFEDDDGLDVYIRDAEPEAENLEFQDTSPVDTSSEVAPATPKPSRGGFRRSQQIAKVKREERAAKAT